MISLDAMPIVLANGRGYAWVDPCDHITLSEISWSLLLPHGKTSKTFYAVGRLKGQRDKILLHRLIAAFMGMDGHIDHRDGDGLNNTRSNLRKATRSQNQFNRRMQSNNKSGFIGVNRTDSKSSWGASIKINKVHTPLGSFRSAESAARVRDMWAKEAYGEFAALNFPEGF